MIELADPRWSSLSHAYGSADDIPDLLRQLAVATSPVVGYETEPWFTLWSSLCHQGDVYDASYAALPHIVAIASGATGPIDFGFFQLPAAIEIARHEGRGPPMPSDLAEAYADAVSGLGACIALHLNEGWDSDTLLSVLAALAVSKGHHRVAEAIMTLDDDMIGRIIGLEFDNG